MSTLASVTDAQNELWGDDWPEVRKHWTIDDSRFLFAHGAYGAIPDVVRAHQADLIKRIDRNPTGFFRREVDDLLEAARLEAANFCGADPEGFAWVRNASEGLTVAFAAIPLEANDEVIITNHIISGVRMAIEQRCAAAGANVIEVQLPFTNDDTQIVAIIEQAISQKTRLVVLDQLAASKAHCLPIQEIARITQRHSIPLIVDGAHAPGMLPLRVDQLGADIWVGNFHKWVCAPHGASGIYASPQWRTRLRPSSVGFRDALPYPQRFNRIGTDDPTPMLCVPVAIKFLRELGIERIQNHNSRLAAYGAEVIRQTLGTAEVRGRFAARRPIALPENLQLDKTGLSRLQLRIAEELKTELSVTPPIGDEKFATIVVSAFVYNHPSQYEQFAELFSRFLKAMG